MFTGPLLILAFATFLGIAAALSLRRRSMRKDFTSRVEALIHEGDVDAWAKNLGVEPAPSASEMGGWSGRATHGGVDVMLHLDVASFGELGLSGEHHVRVELDLGERAPAEISFSGAGLARQPLALSAHHNASLSYHGSGVLPHQRFELGDVPASLAFSSSPLFSTLRAICNELEPLPRVVALEGGRLELTISDARVLTGADDTSSIRSILTHLFDLIDAMPDPFDEARGLDDVVREQGESHTRRWEAARRLWADHAESEEAASLVKDYYRLDALVQGACARWGRTTGSGPNRSYCFKVLRPLSRHMDLGDDVRAHLIAEHPWGSMIDDEIESFVRMDASKRAYGSSDAPGSMERLNDDLIDLFTSRSASAKLTLGVVLKNLTRQGWVPNPKAVMALAKKGDGVTREALLGHIAARGARTSDAPALVTLRDLGLSKAAALLSTLDLTRTGGGLSLASDDSSRGGLTQAGERGAISSVDD